MKGIKETTAKLRTFYQSLAQIINNGGVVVIDRVKADGVVDLINELRNGVIKYCKSVASMLDDIQTYLFLYYPNETVGINPFRFGKFEAVLIYLESSDFVCDFAKYIDTPWSDINNAIKKLLEDSANASDRLSYNQVGVLGRELFIMLGKKVYKTEMNNREDGKKIGVADAKGMLSSYIEDSLKGTSSKELKDYAESAVKLAEHVTHSKSETQTKIDMDSLVTSVIATVAVINMIYKNTTI